MKKFKKVHDKYCNGTFLVGFITITYSDLIYLFGEANSNGDGYKIDKRWILKDKESGIIFTIYNWKNGYNYNDTNGIPVELITDWHIGGFDWPKVKDLLIANNFNYDETKNRFVF